MYPETFPADLDRLAITLGQLPAETPLTVAITATPTDTCRTTARSTSA
jgi:hypothetical protein